MEGVLVCVFVPMLPVINIDSLSHWVYHPIFPYPGRAVLYSFMP